MSRPTSGGHAALPWPRRGGLSGAAERGHVHPLGSATPSLESLYNVERGKYGIDRILKRVDDRQLPKIHLVDMRREALQGKGASPVSST